MDFPWDALWILASALIPLVVIAVLFMASPAIIGALIGQIIRFFRYLFGKKDDE